jgi:hypothetical protein
MTGQTNVDSHRGFVAEEIDDLRICLICGHRVSRQALSRVLAREFQAEVDVYTSCEDALCSELDHDVFVVYDHFGRRRINGPVGARRLRVVRPDAYVVGVTTNPGIDKQFVRSGADTAILVGEHAIRRIVDIVRDRLVTTLYPTAARSVGEGR